MANLSLREVAQSQLDQAPVIDGQLIVCTDTGSTYRDIGTRRIQISKDLEIVSSLPLAPLSNKIYYLRPDSLYVYSGDDWILLNPSKFTLESDKNAVNGEVNINLILNGTAQDKIKIAGGGVTTVTTGETGDITIDTPHPDDLLAALTNDEIDAITGGMVDDSGNPLPTPQVVVDDEKKSWLDRAGAVHLWKTIEAMLGTKVDKIEGFGLSSNDYTTEEKNKLASLSDPDVATTENNGLMSSADKAKLDGIEAEANNYTHPVYEAKQAGLYRISVDNTGHVATADKMTSEELAAEGISPADHTHDLGELVDTLETSADAVEDADTVMVGATVTSGDGSATTKYTRRPLAALWDWIKAKTDTLYAAVGHNHNYAGSTEPGGDALTTLAVRDYNDQNNTIQIGWSGSDLSGDNLAYIAGYTPDRKIHTCSKDGVQNYIGLNNYLPLTGGTMSGAINFANNTWNLVGDDAYMGDHNIGGSFCIMGANNMTGLALVNKDNQGDYALIRYGGGNLNFNKKLEADITGNANTASYILNQGNQTAINSPLDVKGLSVYKVYNNGYPTSYGNVLSIGGHGDGQILAGWSASNNGIERLYYRNRRDMCST